MAEPHTVAPDIFEYYAQGEEQARLSSGAGLLEYLRTLELLARYLPQPPAAILDVGGGPGAYALPLAAQGYEVHLIDPVPLHVKQAARASQAQTASLKTVTPGDARSLDWPAASFEAVLLLGPLYHLPERNDRLTALREAHRVLRPDGVVFAVAISRFASTFEGLQRNLINQPEFRQQVERAVRNGERRAPTAYTHRPEELRREVKAAGFSVEALVAVEGPGWLIPDLDDPLADPERRDNLLGMLRVIEGEASLLGASPHILAVGRRR